jgi:MFS family permease
MGLISDRFGRINMALLSTLVSGILCFAFWLPAYAVQSPMGLLSFFMLISGSTGVFWACIAAVSAEVVGLQELPSALSIIWLTIVPATLFSEPIAIALRTERSANEYQNAQIFISVAFLAATIPMLMLRGWRTSTLQLSVSSQDEAQANGVSSSRTTTSGNISNGQEPSVQTSPWEPRRLLANMAQKRIV